jgi:hypothetical protein
MAFRKTGSGFGASDGRRVILGQLEGRNIDPSSQKSGGNVGMGSKVNLLRVVTLSQQTIPYSLQHLSRFCTLGRVGASY